MYLKSLPITIALSSFISSSVVMAGADPQQMILKVNSDPQATIAYWTPERMNQATSMDLPQSNSYAVRKISTEELLQKQKGLKSETHLGAPPSIQVAPDTHQLFKPIAPKLANNLDAGTLNEQFSSQQLLPLSADLSYPYTTVGKLFFTTPTGNKTCSAAVIAKRVIVTAAHCMHNGNGSSSGWYSNWMFAPAYRDGTTPYQMWAFNGGGVFSSWVNGGGTVPSQWDVAVITLADQSVNGTVTNIGSVVGVLGYKTLSTIPNHAHLLGYPGNLDGGQKMHQVTAQSAVAVAPNNAEYGSDMSIGAGGGPWIQNFGPASAGQTGGTNAGRNLLIGVTSYGFNDTTSLGNGSVILDANFTTLYNFACGLASGNC